MFRKLSVLMVVFALLLAGCASNKETSIDYGKTDTFTVEDQKAATELIFNEFNKWEGCEMHKVYYAGDESNNEENIKWLSEIGSKDYKECMEFFTDFHSPKEPAEDTAWEPDHEYEASL